MSLQTPSIDEHKVQQLIEARRMLATAFNLSSSLTQDLVQLYQETEDQRINAWAVYSKTITDDIATAYAKLQQL